jgi:hypothetical protein
VSATGKEALIPVIQRPGEAALKENCEPVSDLRMRSAAPRTRARSDTIRLPPSAAAEELLADEEDRDQTLLIPTPQPSWKNNLNRGASYYLTERWKIFKTLC